VSALLPHQQRVVDERDELRGRQTRLKDFLVNPDFVKLAIEDRLDLVRQRDLHDELLKLLELRIARFTGVKRYTCFKQVMARPMTRGDYNQLQGWALPENQDPGDEGYLVEYIDGGAPNHPGFPNYISWSPKDVFEAGYKETT
jgi:hypothetical protein